ncbi:hypothetical protein LTR84_011757 [Exophiala bonariae]|uniref:Uncharacterized protein n=1 Tax=Exophiala bonariae TaxID=1690606 RepID=A0AAV9NJC1_9EURO|nr:hypothetical protein LTR84_011757 [Exophiala bonariae]
MVQRNPLINRVWHGIIGDFFSPKWRRDASSAGDVESLAVETDVKCTVWSNSPTASEKASSCVPGMTSSTTSTSFEVTGDESSSKKPPTTEATCHGVNHTTSPNAPQAFLVQDTWLRPYIGPGKRKPGEAELIEGIRKELSLRCRSTSGSSFSIEIYEAGLRPELLALSVLVWCEGDVNRKKAQKYFREDPRVKKELASHGLKYYVLEKAPALSAMPPAIRRQLLCQVEGIFISITEKIETTCGLDLELPDGKRCKVGGLITVDGYPYLQVTRHGFDANLSPIDSTKNLAAKNKTIIDDGPDDNRSVYEKAISTLLRVLSTSLPSLETPTNRQVNTTSPNLKIHGLKVLCPTKPVIDEHVSGEVNDRADFDIALLDLAELPAGILQLLLKPNLLGKEAIHGVLREDFHNCGAVPVRLTGSQPLSGLLTNARSCLQVGTSVFDVKLITLEKKIRWSGTWVVANGKLCGFVVAARTDLPWVYMIPMHAALENLKTGLSTDAVYVPDASEVLQLRKEFIGKRTEALTQEGGNTPVGFSKTHSDLVRNASRLLSQHVKFRPPPRYDISRMYRKAYNRLVADDRLLSRRGLSRERSRVWKAIG